MNGETKVGLFVLIGGVLFGTAIFLLGDYSFQKYYTISAEFIDVAGLPDKSTVKLSGVEVGKIKKIYLKNDKVVVQLAIRDGVKIYRDSRFLVGSSRAKSRARSQRATLTVTGSARSFLASPVTLAGLR